MVLGGDLLCATSICVSATENRVWRWLLLVLFKRCIYTWYYLVWTKFLSARIVVVCDSHESRRIRDRFFLFREGPWLEVHRAYLGPFICERQPNSVYIFICVYLLLNIYFVFGQWPIGWHCAALFPLVEGTARVFLGIRLGAISKLIYDTHRLEMGHTDAVRATAETTKVQRRPPFARLGWGCPEVETHSQDWM